MTLPNGAFVSSHLQSLLCTTKSNTVKEALISGMLVSATGRDPSFADRPRDSGRRVVEVLRQRQEHLFYKPLWDVRNEITARVNEEREKAGGEKPRY